MTANDENDEDIVHLLSSDEELFPISVRACQFSSFLSVALRRVDGINFEHRGNAQEKQIRVPNVRSKTLSIIVEYLNHRLSMKEKKEMKLKRKLRRREEGLTSSSSSNSEEEDLSDEEFERGVVPGWSTEDGMGESLWFFYDTETEEILDQIGKMSEMHKIIECEPDGDRIIALDDETLRKIKKKIDKHIKNTIMRTLQAPAKGAKPRLVCWLNIS